MRLRLVLVGLTLLSSCGPVEAVPSPVDAEAPPTRPTTPAAPNPAPDAEPDTASAEPTPEYPGTPLRMAAPTARSAPRAVTCKVIASGRLDAIDIDRSTLTTGPAIAFTPAGELRTLGLTRWYGTVTCDGKVVQIADDGSIEESTTACDAVLADENGIVVLRDDEALLYGEWAQVVADAPFATRPAPHVDPARSALFFDQIVWVTADGLHLEKSKLDGGAAVGTVTLAREAAAAVRGAATTTDGRLVLTTSAGYEIFDLFTGVALERGPVTGDASSLLGAIACVTPDPYFGSCAGKADGPYCSTTFFDVAYQCDRGNHILTYYCGDARKCQAGEGGRALVARGEIDCRKPVRVDDGCTGLPDGTYCSVTGQPNAYACRGGERAGLPYPCSGTCQVADNGLAVTNADGSPVCSAN